MISHFPKTAPFSCASADSSKLRLHGSVQSGAAGREVPSFMKIATGSPTLATVVEHLLQADDLTFLTSTFRVKNHVLEVLL